MSTILLGGATGFIGSHLSRALERDGHRVIPLSRRAQSPDTVTWDAESGTIDTEALARARPEIVINLAGAVIAKRWTSAHRRRLRDSRVNGTMTLARAIASLDPKPVLFINGSASGYYGAHRGDEILTESSAPVDDFLSRLAQEWEAAVRPAEDAGIRVVLSRSGVVLHRDGGMLARLLLPFRLGLGGPIGGGRHWLPWISMEDELRVMQFFMANAALRGPVNVVSPDPVTNREFTKALGRALHRPAVIPLPAFALELVYGQMARDTILASQRLIPKKLAGAGFEFRHPRIDDALRAALRRSDDPGDR